MGWEEEAEIDVMSGIIEYKLMIIGDSVKFGSGVLALCFDWAIRERTGNVLSFQPPCMICFQDGASLGYPHASAFLEYNHWFVFVPFICIGVVATE